MERERECVLSSQHVCGCIKLQMILFLLRRHASKKKNPDGIQDVCVKVSVKRPPEFETKNNLHPDQQFFSYFRSNLHPYLHA